MDNALSAAEDYLDYSAFSRQGLIDQLSSRFGSGFNPTDATWAVGQLSVNWNEQVVRAAKDYLDYSPFSRDGLVAQLSSSYGSQFTLEEATYAVNTPGYWQGRRANQRRVGRRESSSTTNPGSSPPRHPRAGADQAGDLGDLVDHHGEVRQLLGGGR